MADPLRSPTDRWIVAGIAALMFSAAGLLVFAWRYIDQRLEGIAEEELEERLAATRSRIDAWAYGWSNGMRVETEHIARHEDPRSARLVDRWSTLLRAYWAITAIRLADERGNEVALVRTDSTMDLWETTLGSSNGPPIITRIEPPDDSGHVAKGIAHGVYDPRAQEWFGRALANRRVDAAWSSGDSTGSGSHVSQLIRPDHAGAPYRILCFTIDPLRMGTALVGRQADSSAIAFMLLANGAVIDPFLRPGAATRPEVRAALDAWHGRRTEAVFRIAGGSRMARIITHPLNGTNLTVGVVLDPVPFNSAYRRARWIVIAGMGITLVLGTLLIIAYVRKRRDLLRLRFEQENAHAQQQRLEKAIGERDVLDRETHHRVKNNLQVVSSLLNLQAARLEEGPVKREFLRGKARIDTMARVHQKLYGLPDLRGVDLQEFFEELIRAVRQEHGEAGSRISFEVVARGIKAATDPAIDLGIVLSELVDNCFKHAFPYSTGGHVSVQVEHIERDRFRLTVKDNGIGMQPRKENGGLGLDIVDALTGELDGTIHIRTEGGVRCEVEFRLAPVAGQA